MNIRSVFYFSSSLIHSPILTYSLALVLLLCLSFLLGYSIRTGSFVLLLRLLLPELPVALVSVSLYNANCIRVELSWYKFSRMCVHTTLHTHTRVTESKRESVEHNLAEHSRNRQAWGGRHQDHTWTRKTCLFIVFILFTISLNCMRIVEVSNVLCSIFAIVINWQLIACVCVCSVCFFHIHCHRRPRRRRCCKYMSLLNCLHHDISPLVWLTDVLWFLMSFCKKFFSCKCA